MRFTYSKYWIAKSIVLAKELSERGNKVSKRGRESRKEREIRTSGDSCSGYEITYLLQIKFSFSDAIVPGATYCHSVVKEF